MRLIGGKILATLVLAGSLAACTVPMAAPPPVPPPQEEVKPLPPLSAEVQIWRPGFWEWDGRGYVWVPGEFQLRGTHSGLFQPGHWQQSQGGWVWQTARWL